MPSAQGWRGGGPRSRLCRLGRKLDVADLIKELKRQSSITLKTVAPELYDFHWQKRIRSVSVSPSHVNRLLVYIANQAEHHNKVSFQDEYRRLLKIYGLEWDERYVWD